MANNLTLTSAAYDTSGQKFGSGALSGGYGNLAGGVLLTGAPFAVGLWFKTATTPSSVQVIAGQNQVFWIGYNANGTLHFEFGGFSGTGAKAVNSSAAPTTGVWHFATLSCSASTLTATLDGAVVGTVSLAGASAAFTATGNDPSGKPFGVFAVRTHGGYETSYPYSNGEVDEVSVWAADQFNAAFTVPTVAYSGSEPSLAALYHLDGSGSDSKGSAPSTYALSGPGSGSIGIASGVFAVSVSGVLSSSVVVTPSDGGGGGTFSPTTVTLGTTANASATFTYTASSGGTKTISVTNGGGLSNPAALTYVASATAATTYTLSGPASGVPGSASAPFIVAASGSLGSAVTVTPSDAGGGGSFTPTSVSLAAGTNTSATFTYTPASAGTKTIATANGGGLIDPPTLSYTAAAGQVIAPNNAGIFYSPGNWLVGSASAKTINAGAYFRTIFTGTSVTLTFDMSASSTPFPQLWCRIDGLAWTQVTLASSVSLAMPANTTAWPHHHLEVIVKSTSEFLNVAGSAGGSRWSPQNAAVVLTGITLASGQNVSAPTTLGRNILVYGDSITEGFHSVSNLASGQQDTDGSDARIGWALSLRDLLGSEIGVVGFGGAGINAGGQLGVPALPGSYNYLWSGQARSFTSPVPDIIVVAYGENDGTTVGDQTFISNYKSVLSGLMAATPYSTMIFCMVPLSGKKLADIQTVVTQVASGRVRLLPTTGIFNVSDSVDGQHPLGVAHVGAIAPALANLMRPAMQGVRSPWVRK